MRNNKTNSCRNPIRPTPLNYCGKCYQSVFLVILVAGNPWICEITSQNPNRTVQEALCPNANSSDGGGYFMQWKNKTTLWVSKRVEPWLISCLLNKLFPSLLTGCFCCFEWSQKGGFCFYALQIPLSLLHLWIGSSIGWHRSLVCHLRPVLEHFKCLPDCMNDHFCSYATVFAAAFDTDGFRPGFIVQCSGVMPALIWHKPHKVSWWTVTGCTMPPGYVI